MLDTIIGVFSPKKQIERVAARRVIQVLNSGYSHHGASSIKKALRGWNSVGADADSDIVDNLPKLRERSRDLFMGAPLATGAIKTVVTNVVGPGLRLNANVDAEFLGLSEEETKKWEAHVEREFALWADSVFCDAGRVNTFGQLAALALLSMLQSGDVFAMLPLIKIPGRKYELAVRLIESDLVCSPKDSKDAKVLGGIEVGEYGEPIAYHLADQNGNSSYKAPQTKWTRILALGEASGRRNVLHVMTQERPGQRRGVPLLAPVIETLKQLTRYTEAELMAAVISGMFTVFIKSESSHDPLSLKLETPPTDPGAGSGLTANDKAGDYQLGNGAIVGLAPGESVEMANPGRPNTAFDAFVTAMCRQVGTAIELPYELLIKHFTASYSASRGALLEAWKMFRTRREFMARNFCQPIYEEFLFEAVAKGFVEAPGFFEDESIRAAWCRSEWNGPAQGQLNPLVEANAAVVRVENGFSTRAKETAELTGLNYDSIFPVTVREERERRQAQISLGGNVEAAQPAAASKGLGSDDTEQD